MALLLLIIKTSAQSNADSTYLALHKSISDTLLSRYDKNIADNSLRMRDTFFIHGVIKISVVKEKTQGTKVMDISFTDKQIDQYLGDFDFLKRYDYSLMTGEKKDATIIIPIFMHHNYSKELWGRKRVQMLRSLFGLSDFPYQNAEIIHHIFLVQS